MPKETLLEYYALCAVKAGTPHQINAVASMAASADYSKYFRKSGKKLTLRGAIVTGGEPDEDAPSVQVY